MTKNFNFALKIKESGREGGTCEVLRPCHPAPPKKKNFEHALGLNRNTTDSSLICEIFRFKESILYDDQQKHCSNKSKVIYFRHYLPIMSSKIKWLNGQSTRFVIERMWVQVSSSASSR